MLRILNYFGNYIQRLLSIVYLKRDNGYMKLRTELELIYCLPLFFTVVSSNICMFTGKKHTNVGWDDGGK